MPRIITLRMAGRWRLRRWVAFTMDDFGECGCAFTARTAVAAQDKALAWEMNHS